MIEAYITEYADYFSNWWGLEDGTILPVTDPRGIMWKKFGDNKPVPDSTFMRRIAESKDDE